MPQKKRLVLKPDPELQTQKFYRKKILIFVLDLQIFYEKGSILKAVTPAGQITYIPLKVSFETFKIGRSMGLGYIEGNKFSWVDFYPSPSLSLCFRRAESFTRQLKVSFFLFCILLFVEVKKKIESNLIFGLYLYYLIYFLDLAGWSLQLEQPYTKVFLKNRHFFSVCSTTVNDLPLINADELKQAYSQSKINLTKHEEYVFAKLKGLNENQISLANRIKIIYWVLQQVSLKKISNKFSGQTWMICTELVLYYAQSLRLWIP